MRLSSLAVSAVGLLAVAAIPPNTTSNYQRILGYDGGATVPVEIVGPASGGGALPVVAVDGGAVLPVQVVAGPDGGWAFLVDQGSAAPRTRAWAVYLTDGGIGSFDDPIRTDPVGTTTQPTRVVAGQDGGVLVAVELAGATNEAPACTMPCTVTSATLLFNANANRRTLCLKNNGTATCYWGYTSGVTTSAYTGSLGSASSAGAGDGVGKCWLPAPVETIYGVGLSGCIFEGDAR